MFDPSDDGGGRSHQLKCSEPDNRHYHGLERQYLRVQRVVVNAWRSLLAAAMGCRHPHLPALVLHRAAAGTLLCAHLRIGNHAGHRWSQAGHQQQDQYTELAKSTHS